MDAMLREALRRFRGLRQQFENCLLGEKGEAWEAEAKRFLAKRSCWVEKAGGPTPALVTVPPPPVPGQFVAKERFLTMSERPVPVMISDVGNNFRDWFLGAVEVARPLAALTPFTLATSQSDDEIISSLGGVPGAVTTLGEVWGELEKQPAGPKSAAGQLLTNGGTNLFYVPQAVEKSVIASNGFRYLNRSGKWVAEAVNDRQYLFKLKRQWWVLRAVDVSWHGVGWLVYAYPVVRPSRWSAGSRVFSRLPAQAGESGQVLAT